MTFKNKRNRTYCACHLYRKLIYFLLKKIETNFDLCLSEIIIIFLIWSVLDYKLYYIKLTGLYVIISIHHFYANVTVCHINKMGGETDTVRQVFCSLFIICQLHCSTMCHFLAYYRLQIYCNELNHHIIS
jgi:hypothetical protein